MAQAQKKEVLLDKARLQAVVKEAQGLSNPSVKGAFTPEAAVKKAINRLIFGGRQQKDLTAQEVIQWKEYARQALRYLKYGEVTDEEIALAQRERRSRHRRIG